MVIFARQFTRRIKAHMRTDVLFSRRVIERIAWILDDGCVARRIGVRAEAEQYFAGVVHVAIFIHYHDIFAEHHLSHPP